MRRPRWTYRLTKARTHGAKCELAQRAAGALHAAERADLEGQHVFAASLRGKAAAYNEAVEVVEALEEDRKIPKRAHWYELRAA